MGVRLNPKRHTSMIVPQSPPLEFSQMSKIMLKKTDNDVQIFITNLKDVDFRITEYKADPKSPLTKRPKAQYEI